MNAAHISIDEFFFGPGSDVKFTDDQIGTEVRMLLSTYGVALSQAAKTHKPISEVRTIIRRINEIATAGINHELDLAAALEPEKKN